MADRKSQQPNRRDLLRTTAAALFLPAPGGKRYKNICSVRKNEGWEIQWCRKSGKYIRCYEIRKHVDVSYFVVDRELAITWDANYLPTYYEPTYTVLCDWPLPTETFLKLDHDNEHSVAWTREVVRACYKHMRECGTKPAYPFESVERWLESDL